MWHVVSTILGSMSQSSMLNKKLRSLILAASLLIIFLFLLRQLSNEPFSTYKEDPSRISVLEFSGEDFYNNGVVHVIHQTWPEGPLPPQLEALSSTWDRCLPGWVHRVWTDKENEQLIATKYAWLLNTYHELPDARHRAELMSYVYLLHFGGVFANMEMACVRDITHLLADHEIVLAATIVRSPYPPAEEGYLDTTFLYSRPNHGFWYEVLQLVVDRASKKQVHGRYHVTGAGVLTLALKMYRSERVSWSLPKDVTVYEPQYFNPLSWTNRNGTAERVCSGNVDTLDKCFGLLRDSAYVVNFPNQLLELQKPSNVSSQMRRH